jgi:hypothetical protein
MGPPAMGRRNVSKDCGLGARLFIAAQKNFDQAALFRA